MKFNYIIGNPPYQYPESMITEGANNKKLWKDIMKHIFSLGLSDDISFITPTSARNQFKDYNKIMYFDYRANDYFDVGVNIAAWRWNKNNQKMGFTIDSNGTKHFSTKFIEQDRQRYFDIEEKIKKKMESSSSLLECGPTDFWDEQGPNDIEITVNYNKGKTSYCKKYPNYQNKKLGVSCSLGYSKDKVIFTNQVLGPLQYYKDIQNLSESQIETIMDYLFHPLMVKLVKYERYAKNTGFTVLNRYLPEVDYKLNYKNTPEGTKNLIQTLGISEQDQKYITEIQLD